MLQSTVRGGTYRLDHLDHRGRTLVDSVDRRSLQKINTSVCLSTVMLVVNGPCVTPSAVCSLRARQNEAFTEDGTALCTRAAFYSSSFTATKTRDLRIVFFVRIESSNRIGRIPRKP